MNATSENISLFGVGIYTPTEASRISGVSQGRIRRWMLGYRFRRGDVIRVSPPVIRAPLITSDYGRIALTFRDLIEVLCVHGFLSAGVRWPILRDAHDAAAENLGVAHPFATKRFLTDGHSVLARIGTRAMLDVASNQFAFARILKPFLRTDGVDFAGDMAARWWPLGKGKRVVIDAARSFGQPIVAKEGVPTIVLHRSYLAESRSQEPRIANNRVINLNDEVIHAIAGWFRVEPRSVRAAVEYETQLAA